MKSNGFDKEISDRLCSKVWSSKICDAVYKKRRWRMLQLALITFLSAFFSSSIVWLTFFENQESAIARNELHSWVQEQIYGATVEAQTKVQQNSFYKEETMPSGPVSLDVDSLIEASLDRR
ncbi:hypothetical protein [Leptospira kmetyi]|uniref:Uncharacterized protein n=1 Tax=Leptospira kmetyi TaxID=408139 RepID=A0A2M9XRU9_9LEPT|nr:hypothetical protein [Leptospira kmetyi]AYV56150.1 hypothetical protein EFP84_11940 [Leptospira kmetyi]EQA51800.1 hypothetical protein LEP1GSC052_3781 [Leptospira kmetyi serovar Malaysia str. Bejo-Iso9]PJZ28524.1 hypothetical protein CH378_17335 [Leptospira kmetyi]PJZ41903.1 hypothetical protein CH370_06475 [Leptospira kmetyi]TGK16028.1 hypothetical protein EHO62_09710 [Leptospira kmetyi]